MNLWQMLMSAFGTGATNQHHSVHSPYTKKQKREVGYKEKRKRKNQRKAQLMGRRK